MNVRGACFCEVGHDAIDRLDHEMHVDRRLDAVLAQRRAHERTDGQIRHIVIVHHIEVHEIRPRGEHGFDLLSQAGEVGGQNRRSNPERLHVSIPPERIETKSDERGLRGISRSCAR